MDVYVSKDNQIKRNKHRRLRLFLTMAGIAALLALIWYTVFISQVFKVKLEFTGLERLGEDQLRQELVASVFDGVFSGLLGQNNYFAWPSKINLKEPLVASLEVEKNLLEKKIIFHVKEREPYGIWCVSDCYWFSNDGIVFAPAPLTEGSLILRVDDDAAGKLAVGQLPVSEQHYGYISKIFKFFEEKKQSVTSYALKNELQEFRAFLANGPEVRFSLRLDPKSSLDALAVLLAKQKYQKASYIDLTVENRVYTK